MVSVILVRVNYKTEQSGHERVHRYKLDIFCVLLEYLEQGAWSDLGIPRVRGLVSFEATVVLPRHLPVVENGVVDRVAF